MPSLSLIVGQQGNLAKALTSELDHDKVVSISRSTFSTWVKATDLEIAGYFKSHTVREVFVAAGITNPTSNIEDIQTINIDLPIKIAKVCNRLNIPIYTFGSIHENSSITNPYLESKRRLVEALSSSGFEIKIVHFQLHTLYGGKPIPHMFLGQIANAILAKTPFNMSSGLQLREFHHCADDAHAIAEISKKGWDGLNVQITQLNSGKIYTLRDIANSVFSRFDALNLLNIGVFKENPGEVFISPNDSSISPYFFRDSEIGIHKWIKQLQESRQPLRS